MNPDHGPWVLGLVISLVVVFWHRARAVLALFPTSMRLEADERGRTEVPGALSPHHEELVKLGFEMIGTHVEHPVLGKPTTVYDYVSAATKTFASTFQALNDARLYLLTPTNQGMVLTADFRRASTETPGRYLSGHLDGATPERLLKAHLRRIPELGTPLEDLTLDGRVAAAKAWYGGVGKADVRQENALSLLWTIGALGMVGASLFRLLG